MNIHLGEGASTMLRRILLGGVTLALAASMALAKPGVVKTKDGTSFQGDITTDDAYVYITNKNGIQTKLDKRNVASMDYADSVEATFAKQLAQLAPTDVAGRIKLAHWAYDQRQYKQARDALDSALKIDPNNAEATEFLDTVQQQMRLEETTTAEQPPATPSPATEADNGGSAPGASSNPAEPDVTTLRLLTPEEINIIRQKEWTRNDTAVRVRLINDVKRQFVNANGLDIKQFNRLSTTEQAWQILHQGSDAMKKNVELLTDPASIAEFRKPTVSSRIMAGCASSGCHGAAGAGGFRLITPGDSEAVDYTNFYILKRYSKSIGDRKIPMINRSTPDASLVLQYGLPAEMADMPHPAMANYRGVFRSKNDPAYKAVTHWIGGSLSIMAPDYGLDYKLPTTQPSGRTPTTTPSE
jgi:hypothetical protein